MTIPSYTAALVALIASVILSLISLTSISEAPPTLIMPTPPLNLANLSCNFSLSYSEVVSTKSPSIDSILSSMIFLSPRPSKTTVSSFEISIYLH